MMIVPSPCCTAAAVNFSVIINRYTRFLICRADDKPDMSINPRNIFEPETRTRKKMYQKNPLILAPPTEKKRREKIEIPALIVPEMMLQATRMKKKKGAEQKGKGKKNERDKK